MNKRLNCVLGTMTFGQQVGSQEALEMLHLYFESGFNEIDSAYVYNDGATEKLLGKILCNFKRNEYKISTKANPRITGKLDKEAIKLQLSGSLESLQLDYVDLFYLHMPDYDTPIHVSLETCAEMHAQGRFKRLGISNYPSWMLSEIWHICDREAWPKPSVYQGLYNALSRNIESELIPAARYYGVSIYAFNPLAGGLLTGKYGNHKELPNEGRFALRRSYLERYWNEDMLATANSIADSAVKCGLSAADAALAWLVNSSMLSSSFNDSIIVGASKLTQLEQNLSSLSISEIPEDLQNKFQEAWEAIRAESPLYFKTS
ncbi:MAG: aldo/keto reductase [Candidatus Cloacimonetes bacterium]|nr:aldo/keto reductase [Candidatus Cloacimonadota bacterium]